MSVGPSSRRRRAAVVVVLCPLLASCLSSRARNVADSFAAPTARITVGTTVPLDSLDPVSGQPGIALIAPNLFQTVVRASAHNEKVVPEAATCSFHDPTTYVCALVPGQAFSNGDPVTAQDVAFSIRRAIRLGGAAADAVFAPMASVATSGNTVTFTLSTADSGWPLALASSYAAIVNRHVFPKSELLTDTKVVGSGPYVVAETEAGDGSLVFGPNPHYGGSDHLDNAKVVVKPEANDAALVSDLTSGVVDVAAPIRTTRLWTALRAVPGTATAAGPLNTLHVVGFDDASMPGNGEDHRVAIRQAVAQSLDRIAVINSIPAAARPVTTTVPPQDAGSAGAATATLSQAGVATPVDLTLDYNEDRLADAGPATALQAQLDATGLFKVTLQAVPWETFRAGVGSGKYGVYLYSTSERREIAQVEAASANGGLVVPLWQDRIGAVALNRVSGLAGAMATPGVLAYWFLGRQAAE